GEVRRVPPRRDGEQALARLAALPEIAGVHVDTDAAPVDLTRAQLDEADRRRGDAAFLRRGSEGVQRFDRAGYGHRGIRHTCLHRGSPFRVTSVEFGSSM